MALWYHGTNKETADIILLEGFKKGTFFAKHLEDSVGYGGEYVFTVFFEDSPTDYWEYVCDKLIPKENIFILHRYKRKKLYYSKDMEYQNQIAFHKKVNPSKTICLNCKGKGEHSDYNFDVRWRDRKKTLTCTACKGKGVI